MAIPGAAAKDDPCRCFTGAFRGFPLCCPPSVQAATIPTPLGPIEITLPGSCGPLETCVGLDIAGICLGSCVPFDPGLPFVPGPPPGNGAPPQDFPPLPPPGQPQPQLGGCPPRAGVAAAVLCPAGCHPNKSDYFLRNGTFVLKGSKCVRNRRRNPLNPRALDRAAGRLRSAQKVGRFLAKVKIPRGRCR